MQAADLTGGTASQLLTPNAQRCVCACTHLAQVPTANMHTCDHACTHRASSSDVQHGKAGRHVLLELGEVERQGTYRQCQSSFSDDR